jgi:hypothetical protein
VTSCEIHDGQNGTSARFPLLNVIPTLLHPHLSPALIYAIALTKQHIITISMFNSGFFRDKELA